MIKKTIKQELLYISKGPEEIILNLSFQSIAFKFHKQNIINNTYISYILFQVHYKYMDFKPSIYNKVMLS